MEKLVSELERKKMRLLILSVNSSFKFSFTARDESRQPVVPAVRNIRGLSRGLISHFDENISHNGESKDIFYFLLIQLQLSLARNY
jgi:hypothetical protein